MSDEVINHPSRVERKLARLQRQATIIAGLAARQSDGAVVPAVIVRQARLIDAEIVKQSEAEV